MSVSYLIPLLLSLGLFCIRAMSDDRAIIEIAGGKVYEMGEGFLAAPTERKIKIKNVGTLPARDFQVYGEELKGAFGFKGGAYPGEGGTCKSVLAVGQSCLLNIAFSPTKEKTYEGQIQFAYHDGVRFRVAEKKLRGKGVAQGCAPISRKQESFSFLVDRNADPKFSQGDYWCMIQQKEEVRSAYVHVPRSANFPMAAIFVFHGPGENAFGMEAMTNFNAMADGQHFVTIFPVSEKGSFKPLPEGIRDPAAWRNMGGQSDDVAFVRSLLALLAEKIDFDPSRVYAAGISNGATMAYRLACEMSDSIAAVAAVGGGILTACTPSLPVSVLHIHGTEDPSWPYAGGPDCFSPATYPNPMQSPAYFETLNQCSVEYPARVSLRQIGMECYTRGPCADGTDIMTCTVARGGSTWPGGRTPPAAERIPWDETCALPPGKDSHGVGRTLRYVVATDLIWKFFRQHVRAEKVRRMNASENGTTPPPPARPGMPGARGR